MYYLTGFPMFAPAWTVTSNALCVSMSPVSLRAALESQAGAGATSLLDNPDFQRSRKSLPARVVSLQYTDTRQSVAAMYAMLTGLAPMFANQPDSPLDLTKLPSLASLQSNLFGSVTVVTADDRGIAMHSYSPLGPDLISSTPAIGILAGMLLPALNQARGHAREASCLSNLKQIGLACHMYAADNKGKFPPKLDDLVPNYLPQRRVFHCPSAPGSDTTLSYSYVAGLTDRDTDKALAYDAQAHADGTRNVLFADGHVQPLPEVAFQELLHPTR